MTQYLDTKRLNKEKSVNLNKHELYLNKSKEMFRGMFNYDGVIFGSEKDIITLKCLKHGEFNISVKNHLRNSFGGCVECAVEQQKKDILDNFKERGTKKFNGMFTYEKVTVIQRNTRITVTCTQHGEFNIIQENHMQSGYGGCAGCREPFNLKKSADRLKERMSAQKNGQFVYDKTDVFSKAQVTITCKDHGDFETLLERHRYSEYGNCEQCLKIGDGKRNAHKFILRAQLKHGDQFNYDKVDSIHLGDIITVACKDHGEFDVPYANHTESSDGGCLACRKEKRLSHRGECFENFKKASFKKHGDKYSFDKTEYSRSKAFVITCKEHGEFTATAHHHLDCDTAGCGKCVTDAKKHAVEKNFQQESTLKHGDKFDYSNTEHKSKSIYVMVRCKKHGEFKVAKYAHVSLDCGGCEKCRTESYDDKRLARFKVSATKKHGTRFTYDAVKPSDLDGGITIHCAMHGVFQTNIRNHMRYENGDCQSCLWETKRVRKQERYIQLLKEVHGEAFNYDKTYFVDNLTPFTVACVKHGEFTIVPLSHHTRNFGGCEGCKKDQFNLEKSQELLTKLEEKYADRFEYIDFKVQRKTDTFTARCKTHGDFKTSVKNLLEDINCPSCMKKDRSNKRLSDFIHESKAKYGDNHHDYSLIDAYVNKITTLPIRCIKHDIVFNQTPLLHLNGSGCPTCKAAARFEGYVAEQIEALAQHLGCGYDLNGSTYKGWDKNIDVVCKKHGVFERQYNMLLKIKMPCYKCANEKQVQKKREIFLKKAHRVHGDRYDYTDTVMEKAFIPIEVRCREHGVFSILRGSHLAGGNCPKCISKNKIKRTKDEWLSAYSLAHGERYTYTRVPNLIYLGKSITVGCRVHGDFLIRPETHLRIGCPTCRKEESFMVKCINMAQGKFKGKYSFEMTAPISSRTQPLKLVCNQHGLFTTTYKSMRKAAEDICPTCLSGGMNTEILKANITERFGDKLLTSMIVFSGWDKPIKLQCRQHKEFYTTPRKAMRMHFDCRWCKEEEKELNRSKNNQTVVY